MLGGGSVPSVIDSRWCDWWDTIVPSHIMVVRMYSSCYRRTLDCLVSRLESWTLGCPRISPTAILHLVKTSWITVVDRKVGGIYLGCLV
jgi:hypothetical protein